MSLAPSPVIGTICIEPLATREACPCDDSTLGLVLESFAHLDSLAEEPVRLVASTRLSRLAALGPALGVRANLAQLLADLQAEYEQVTERLES
ncbi:MAG TPA: hypothetical protein VFB80_23140 [Pirellulaceae bacterium]|nr:hypothetical protein [Pirellulaceae bacterium]